MSREKLTYSEKNIGVKSSLILPIITPVKLSSVNSDLFTVALGQTCLQTIFWATEYAYMYIKQFVAMQCIKI